MCCYCVRGISTLAFNVMFFNNIMLKQSCCYSSGPRLDRTPILNHIIVIFYKRIYQISRFCYFFPGASWNAYYILISFIFSVNVEKHDNVTQHLAFCIKIMESNIRQHLSCNLQFLSCLYTCGLTLKSVRFEDI